MKVVCIDCGTTLKCINSNRLSMKLIEGNIYNVLETREWTRGRYYYILKEMECDVAYESHLFVPLSDKDEKEILQQRQNEKMLISKI